MLDATVIVAAVLIVAAFAVSASVVAVSYTFGLLNPYWMRHHRLMRSNFA